jgi:phenylalanine-4-hydroxylase
MSEKPTAASEYADNNEYCVVHEMPIDKAPVPKYTDVENGTWEILLETQQKLIHGRACEEFVFGVQETNFPKNRIPLLRDVSKIIKSHTGWELLRVDGLVHPREFFALLARKIFPSTDFIRKREELKYTPAPDMFHDLFGHAPLLTSNDFTEFFETVGRVGVNAMNRYGAEHEINRQLTRIYWFTVEFGLVQTPEGLRAYGSGTVSSPEELVFCLTDKCRKHPFVIDKVAEQNYDIWHLQEDVFVIPSFAQLGNDFRDWARRNKILD